MTTNEKLLIYIKQYPLVKQDCVEMHKKHLPKTKRFQIKRENNKLFGKDDEISITRDIILKVSKKDLIKFILLVIYWGFPKNSHGIITHTYNSFPDVKDFTKIFFHTTKDSVNFKKIFEKYKNKIGGLGIATLSKILYFAKTKITYEGQKISKNCLILDSRVKRGICRVMREVDDHGMSDLYDFSKKDDYIGYVAKMHEISERLTEKHTPEELEYALWRVGECCNKDCNLYKKSPQCYLKCSCQSKNLVKG